MGRAEAFALKNPPLDSFVDGIGNGLGYGFILLVVGFFRELFGSGTLFNIPIFNPELYIKNGMFLLPPSAFFIIGLIIWVVRIYDPSQVEK